MIAEDVGAVRGVSILCHREAITHIVALIRSKSVDGAEGYLVEEGFLHLERTLHGLLAREGQLAYVHPLSAQTSIRNLLDVVFKFAILRQILEMGLKAAHRIQRHHHVFLDVYADGIFSATRTLRVLVRWFGGITATFDIPLAASCKAYQGENQDEGLRQTQWAT